MGNFKKSIAAGMSSSVPAAAPTDLVTLEQVQALLAGFSVEGHTHDSSDIENMEEVVREVFDETFEDSQTVTWEESGVRRTAHVRLKSTAGLAADADGLYVMYGTGEYEVARGNHGHEQLHAAASITSDSLQVTVTEGSQEFNLEVRVAVAGGLQVTDSGLRVDFGDGENEVARGADVAALAEWSHRPVTVAATDTLTLTLGSGDNAQRLTGAVRLDPDPPEGRGLIVSSSAGIAVQLGSGSREAAPGDHQHNNATDGWGGFMSADDKAKLDTLAAFEPVDTLSVHLELTDGELLATVLVGTGLRIGSSGVELNTDYLATPSRNGLMSAADKLKLDGLSNFEVDDTASINLTLQDGVLTAAVKIGDGLIIDEGEGVRFDPDYLATHTHAGQMSAADKIKLDLLQDSGVPNVTVEDTDSVNLTYTDEGVLSADVITGNGLKSTNSGVEIDPDFTATPGRSAPGETPTGRNGLMPKEDKARFDLCDCGGFDDDVHCILLFENSVYVGGKFTTYGGVSTPGAVKLDRDGKIDPLFDVGDGFESPAGGTGPTGQPLEGGVDYLDVLVSSGVEIVYLGAQNPIKFQQQQARHIWKLDSEGTQDFAFSPPQSLADLGSNQLVGMKYVGDRLVVATWQTLRALDSAGATLQLANGAVNLHGLERDGNQVLLSSRAYTHTDTPNLFNGEEDPKGFKKLSVEDFSQNAAFVANAGTGAEATCAGIAVAPDGSFYVTGNTLAFEGADFSWDGGSDSQYEGMYKLLSSGVADPDFEIHLEMSEELPPTPFCIADNGDIYFGGPVSSINGNAVIPWRLYRISSSGEFIRQYRHFNDTVNDCKWRPGRLYVGGKFTAYGKAKAGRFIILGEGGEVQDCCGSGGDVDQLPPVEFTPPSGANKPMDVTLKVRGFQTATIYYTLDGSNPTTGSTVYTGPISLSGSGTSVIKAFAVKTGYADSVITFASYAELILPKLPKVQFVPAGGNVPVEVTLVCAVAGATIRYTTDGTDPDGSSPIYTDPISLEDPATIKAFAEKTLYVDSDPSQAIFGNWELINYDTFTDNDPENQGNPDELPDSPMEGAAAIGLTGEDYWNPNWAFDTVIEGLKDSNGNKTGVNLAVEFGSPTYGMIQPGTPSPALFQKFLWAADSPYGYRATTWFRLTGLEKGEYDLYVYGAYRAGLTSVTVYANFLSGRSEEMTWNGGDPESLVLAKTYVKILRIDVDPNPAHSGYFAGLAFAVQGYISGWQLKRSGDQTEGGTGFGGGGTVIEPSGSLNVDFCPGTSTKAGAAASGTPGAFWNSHVPNGTAQTLLYSNGASSSVQIAVTAQTGHIIQTGTFSHPDPMYGRFYYQNGGHFFMVIANLPVGEYDIYVYAHGDANEKNSIMKAVVSNFGTLTQYDYLSTVYGPGWDAPAWTAGIQYVRFHVHITHAVNSVGLTTKALMNAYLNGVQIVKYSADIVMPAVVGPTAGATTYFSGGASKPAGTYRIKYVNGAVIWNSRFAYYQVDPATMDPDFCFKVRYNTAEGVQEAGRIPGWWCTGQASEAAVANLLTGMYVDIAHTGGQIGMNVGLGYYAPTIQAGNPSPRFELIRLS